MAEVLVEGGRIDIDGVPAAARLVTDRDLIVGCGGRVPPEGKGEGDEGRTRNEGEDERGEDEDERRDTLARGH